MNESMVSTDDLAVRLPALPLLRLRFTLRLLDDATLPAFKGALLRGGLGHAFQRVTCPPPCWGHADQCAVASTCPYHQVFEPQHQVSVGPLHDLQDIPRSFVVEPPPPQTEHEAGSTIEFGLVLIAEGIERLPLFIQSFEQLAALGLGKAQARARLERVEALAPLAAVGSALYTDGRVLQRDSLPLITADLLAARAASLPPDLRLTLRTPLRVKAEGRFIERLDLMAIMRAACWRVQALSAFYTAQPWEADYRPLVAAARAVQVVEAETRWVDWERTSGRGVVPQQQKLGGIVGSAVLRGVPPALRAVLLLASVVHVGKACVFGHGKIDVAPASHL